MKNKVEKFLNSASILILVAAMLVSFVVFFGAPAQAWDGTASSTFASGSGTESSPYVIKTENQFGYFISQLNNSVTYEGLYVRLDADLNMTGSPWTYATTAKFAGTLDGNGHTVTTDSRLMPDVAATGIVKKLNVVGDQVAEDSVLCEWNYGQIIACSVRGNIPAEGVSDLSAAGLVCIENYGTIRYCGAVGSVMADPPKEYDAYAAGIAARNSGTVDSCFAAVSATASAVGKYDYDYEHPVANNTYNGSPKVTNSYYDKTLFTASTAMGTPLTTAEMQGSSFLNIIAGFTVPGVQWVSGSDGYPVLEACGLGTVDITGWNETGKATYHSSSHTVILKRGGVTSGTLYYTLDGTDPKTSSTRKSATSSTVTISLSGDKTVTAVVQSGGLYGSVAKVEFVYMPGSGTQSSPYQILTKKGLDAVRLDPAASYKLVTDLTFTDADYTMGGVAGGGWNPIPSFTGTFDGAGHSITGLRGNSGGLFKSNSGTITSLRMLNHKLFRGGATGPIANTNTGTVTRCYAKSAFTESSLPRPVEAGFYSESGGIVGDNGGGTVSYCMTEGVVHASAVTEEGQHYLGGIVGSGGRVENCISTAYLISDYANRLNYSFMGGIAGGASDVYDCWADSTYYLNTLLSYQAYIGPVCGHFVNGYAFRSVAPAIETVKMTTQGGNTTTVKHDYAPSYQHCYRPTDGSLPADFLELDFDTEWMLTDSGVLPQGVMDADGHCYSLSSYTQDSCDVTGTTVMACDLCGKTRTETIAAPGHIEVTDAAVETTCSAPGLTEGSHCERCEAVLVPQETVEQLPHNYVNGICSVCSAERTILASGTCGTNLTWKVYDCYTLVIKGTGKMDDYSYGAHDAPWAQYNQTIQKVAISEGVTSVGRYAFMHTSNLTTLELPKSVTAIGEGAFEDCMKLAGELDLSNVTSFEKYAFLNDSSLSKITLSNSLTEIPRSCFAGIDNMTEITIPASVTAIRTYAFDACEVLTKIYFSGVAPLIEENAFDDLTATVYYPSNYGSWNSVAGKDYGGTLTWEGYSEEDAAVSLSPETVGTNDFGAVITAPAGGWKTGDNTFRVSCDQTCIVAVSYDGGKTYTRLKATQTDSGYDFAVSNVDAGTKIVAALAGDSNGDGKLTTADATKLQAAILGKTSLDTLGALAADVNGDGKTSTADATRMRAVILGKTELKW